MRSTLESCRFRLKVFQEVDFLLVSSLALSSGGGGSSGPGSAGLAAGVSSSLHAEGWEKISMVKFRSLSRTLEEFRVRGLWDAVSGDRARYLVR